METNATRPAPLRRKGAAPRLALASALALAALAAGCKLDFTRESDRKAKDQALKDKEADESPSKRRRSIYSGKLGDFEKSVIKDIQDEDREEEAQRHKSVFGY